MGVFTLQLRPEASIVPPRVAFMEARCLQAGFMGGRCLPVDRTVVVAVVDLTVVAGTTKRDDSVTHPAVKVDDRMQCPHSGE